MEISLPSALRGKPIWAVEQLATGQLAVALEGSIAVGTNDGNWRVAPTPSGQIARVVCEAHNRVLVAGNGFAAFYDEGVLHRISNLNGEYINAEAIPQGWLLAGSDGVWQIDLGGDIKQLAAPSAKATDQFRLCRIGRDIIVSAFNQSPSLWTKEGLIPAPRPQYANYAGHLIIWADQSFRISELGIGDANNPSVLPPSVNKSLIKAGIVGLADTGSWILVPTFGKGLIAIDKQTGAKAWDSQKFGEIYFFKRFGNKFLLGTAKGVYAMHDPWAVDFVDVDGKAIMGLLATAPIPSGS